MQIISSDSSNRHAALGSMLDAYDCPAILVSADYQILATNRHYEHAFGRLDVSKQHRCFEVSHGYEVPCDQAGESCPLIAAKTSQNRERVLHIHQTPEGKEHVDVEMLPIFDDNNELEFFVELLRPVPLASGKVSEKRLIGKSEAFNKTLERISRVGSTDASVLLLGESGTGKELAAMVIHQAGTRKHRPMVTLECAGLSDALFESELFGHVKGAFTGAHSNKKGLVELADGGTLFLDEIGDVPLSMQIKLLRLIETGTYRAVGSAEVKTSNFRLICATHKNILRMVGSGDFRQDLYYRINVFPIHLPTLAERSEDIPLIAKALLEQISPNKALHLTESAYKSLAEHHFQGNIRELRNILHRAVVLADTNVIDKNTVQGCFDADLTQTVTANEDDDDWVDLKTAEKRYLNKMMAAYNNNKETVANIAGLSLRSLYRKLED